MNTNSKMSEDADSLLTKVNHSSNDVLVNHNRAPSTSLNDKMKKPFETWPFWRDSVDGNSSNGSRVSYGFGFDNVGGAVFGDDMIQLTRR